MLSGYQFFTGGLIMTAIGAASGGNLQCAGINGYLLMVYMGFISASAYTLWSILLKYNNVSKISAYKFMNPIFGAVLSYILLNEKSQMGINTVVAMVFVSTGIYVVNKGNKKADKADKND
jgi:drug/metabolite transporter (DMT)-like permease